MSRTITQYKITDRAAGCTMRWTKAEEHMAFRHSNLEYECSGWQERMPVEGDEVVDERPSSIRRFVITKVTPSGASATTIHKFFYANCKLVEILRKPEELQPQGYDY